MQTDPFTENTTAELMETQAFTQLPLEDWTDDEVILFYDSQLATKPVNELTARELQITVRYGDIAKQRRDQAEQTGFEAEVEAIRRQVARQVERYALAALLEEYHKRSFPEVAKGDASDEVHITVQFGQRQIELRASDLAAAFGGFANPKVREFGRALEGVLALAKSAATQHRNRIERSKGRNWAAYTKDLRWPALVHKMRAEDGENL